MAEAVDSLSSTAMPVKYLSLPWYRRYTRWRQTSHAEAVDAEQHLLALSGTQLEVADVPVTATGVRDSKENYMHTIVGGAVGTPSMVLVPGYGAGAGFFFRNMRALCSHFRVHAVDLLGTGLSGRPSWTASTREGAEEFFLSSLASWRERMALDKVVLVGHSMGGYLAACYALKHPEHVQHLILVCPAGISKQPDDWQPPERVRDPWSIGGMLYRTVTNAWEWGLTPGAVIRMLGPWGPGTIQGYARRRFKEGMGFTDEDTAAFEQYFYHIMAAPGSGEHALRHLLAPFAWGREPLEDALKQIKVPVTFIYGEHDWMDPKGAARALEALSKSTKPATPGDLRIFTIPESGHYTFLDQPEEFLSHMMTTCQPYIDGSVGDKAKYTSSLVDQPKDFPSDAFNLFSVKDTGRRDVPGGRGDENGKRRKLMEGKSVLKTGISGTAYEGLSKSTDL